VLHEIFSEYGYLEDIFMFKEFALVQFQHVRHAILALFRHNGTRVYENCCVNMLCDGYSTHRFKLKLQM
jgi:hypothetical protein